MALCMYHKFTMNSYSSFCPCVPLSADKLNEWEGNVLQASLVITEKYITLQVMLLNIKTNIHGKVIMTS